MEVALKKCIYCGAEGAAPRNISIGDPQGWKVRHHIECGACFHLSPGYFEVGNDSFEAKRKAAAAWNYMEYKA